MVANPARGQRNREILPGPRSRLRIWSRETGSAVLSRASLFILHIQVESDVQWPSHIARVWINRVRLRILLVVS